MVDQGWKIVEWKIVENCPGNSLGFRLKLKIYIKKIQTLTKILSHVIVSSRRYEGMATITKIKTIS